MQSRNRLMALLAANRAKPKLYEVRQASGEKDATVYLYDMIDPFWGVSAKQFVKDLNSIKAGTIHLRINSPGGDVFEGRAIATAIAQHQSKIIAHVDGLAASAASWIALSAAEVEMSAGSFIMIHNSMAFSFGNAADLLATAEVLKKIDTSLVDEYVKYTGQTAEQIKSWMDAETWFTSDEAVTEGFADRVAAEAAAKNQWDLSAFVQPPTVLVEPPTNADSDEQSDLEHAERRRRFELDVLQRIA